MDYEGGKSNGDYRHKIVIGNVNMISSIYGKKFNVMSQQLHEYCRFSIEHLPKKLTNKCLGAFLAGFCKS